MANKLKDKDLNKVTGGVDEKTKNLIGKIDEVIEDFKTNLSCLSNEPSYNPIMTFLGYAKYDLFNGQYHSAKLTLKNILAIMAPMLIGNYEYREIIGRNAHKIDDIICSI